MDTEETTALAVPIREISRLTGVNTVTLRAWERRYGLLKPMRTGKGHRLYSTDDLQRVKDIQAWLVRGLAISKVKAILASDDNASSSNATADSVWDEHSAQIDVALGRLNRRKLELLFSALMASYPTELIADQLLAPILERMQRQQDYGTHAQLAFFRSVVTEQFYFGQFRQRQTARGKRLLLVKLNPEESDILPLALNYSLLVHNFQSEYSGFLPFAEWVFAALQLQVEGIIIYSDSAVNLSTFEQQLIDRQKVLQIPFFVAGKIARMMSTRRETQSTPVLTTDFFILTSDSLQSVITEISQRLS